MRMASSEKASARPDFRILHVSDGSTVAESIASRFSGVRYNLLVELTPLDKFQVAPFGSLSSMATSPPTPAWVTSVALSPRPTSEISGSPPIPIRSTVGSPSISIPPRLAPVDKPACYGTVNSTPSISSLSTSSFSSAKSSVFSSSLPEAWRTPITTGAKTTEKSWMVSAQRDDTCTITVLLFTPGMARHLRNISEDKRLTMEEFLLERQDPVALDCFVTRNEAHAQLTNTFGEQGFRWRHLEVGESRESFSRCVIGLIAFLEEERDAMPLPSLKLFSILPEKPVMPGESLYILLDTRLSELPDASVLHLRCEGQNLVTASRISDLLYEFEAPEYTETSLSIELFTTSEQSLGRETIHYVDKTQMVTSLLLQLENPVQLVSQLFPAELVSRDAIDSALCNWLGAARSSVMDEGSQTTYVKEDLPTLFQLAVKFNLACLARTLLSETGYRHGPNPNVLDGPTPADLNDPLEGSCNAPRDAARSPQSSGFGGRGSSTGEDYVKPDTIASLQHIFCPDNLQFYRDSGRKFSSISCPEIGTKDKQTEAKPPRSRSFMLPPELPTTANQAETSASDTGTSFDCRPNKEMTVLKLFRQPVHLSDQPRKVKDTPEAQISVNARLGHSNQQSGDLWRQESYIKNQGSHEFRKDSSFWKGVESRESQNIYESLEAFDGIDFDNLEYGAMGKSFSFPSLPPLPPPRRRSVEKKSSTAKGLHQSAVESKELNNRAGTGYRNGNSHNQRGPISNKPSSTSYTPVAEDNEFTGNDTEANVNCLGKALRATGLFGEQGNTPGFKCSTDSNGRRLPRVKSENILCTSSTQQERQREKSFPQLNQYSQVFPKGRGDFARALKEDTPPTCACNWAQSVRVTHQVCTTRLPPPHPPSPRSYQDSKDYSWEHIAPSLTKDGSGSSDKQPCSENDKDSDTKKSGYSLLRRERSEHAAAKTRCSPS